MPLTGAERGRVWILEDSALEAEMARRALAPTQEVEIFPEGSALLEHLATGGCPDVAILDLQLPGVTGLEVCRSIRTTYDPMRLPLLVLTGQGRKEDVVEALAAGANDYVTKPYDVAELVARVATLVRTSHFQRAQTRRARQLALAADVGAALTKGKTVGEIARASVELIAVHLEASSVALWVRRDDELVLAAASGTEPPVAPSVVDAVVESGAPYTAERESAAPGKRRHALAALPLRVTDEVVGVVAYATPQPLSEASSSFATVVDLLALGFARARAEEERAASLERERNTRADAEAANRSKDEFLAMVSHELRTPLNAITGWTGILLGGNLAPERVKRALETIDRNARAQAQLIEDLLDISRIISGKLRLNVAAVDVANVCEMSLESVRLAAEAKGIRLEARVDRDAGEVMGDAERLQQVVWNLLSNAIKFTPPGGAVVVGAHRVQATVEISVSDTGQGISPEFLPYVFDRFKQADGTMTRAKGGLGLGLAIVRQVVELHGGTIGVQSEGLGKGASFIVRVPVTVPVRTEPPRLRAAASKRPGALDRPREVEGMRVLVIDDEADARDLVKTLLESCKVDVTIASSAAEGFDLLQRLRPDVLLSDIAMPEEDGLSLIRRVRALSRDAGGRVPAVALTAYARLEDRTRALRAGFNSHVAKPIDAAELLAVLSSLTATR